MESFREALDRLVNQLNRDVLSTIEAITLTELSAEVGKARASRGSAKKKAAKAPVPVALPKATPRTVAPKPPRPPKPPKPPKAARTKKLPKATPAAPEVSAVQLEQAVAFAVSRGSKGVIARQLEAHLVSLGFASGANVLGILAERNLVRDAGFRRATGNGNATEPVFVAVAR